MSDLYHRWLGIPPGPRPPTHYQLLGIDPLEHDREVITAAAIRQSSFVRHFQAGPHARDCARILGELSLARLTLLDPARRAAYDARWPKADVPEPAEIAVVPEVVDAARPDLSFITPTLAIVIEPEPFRARRRRESSGRFARTAAHLVITVGAIAGGAAIIQYEKDRSRPPDSTPAYQVPSAGIVPADTDRPPRRPFVPELRPIVTSTLPTADRPPDPAVAAPTEREREGPSKAVVTARKSPEADPPIAPGGRPAEAPSEEPPNFVGVPSQPAARP